jgi:hypothetical protein
MGRLVSYVIAAIAAAWAALALDVVVESVAADGTAIRFFGHTLSEPTSDSATVTLVVLGATVGGIVAVGVMTLVENLQAKELGDEVRRRAEERSVSQARLVAQNDLLGFRIGELQRQHDDLLARRDRMLEELGRVAAKTKELRAEARLSEDELAKLTERLVVMPELRSTPDDPSGVDD